MWAIVYENMQGRFYVLSLYKEQKEALEVLRYIYKNIDNQDVCNRIVYMYFPVNQVGEHLLCVIETESNRS